ncbi:MAG: glutamine--fructose-6-phosphate transaminase (isomerizing) [Deltaproteobacteria bacterium]|nr:glutamine--fructose-6-phosphate transaminase (isomerizing) [Deltaproteobacteria bacterium]
MCGIMGYIGEQEASRIIVDGLRRLEYRGYDSAGIATLVDGQVDIRRCVGKLDNLEKLLRDRPLQGAIGLGHTRWATHGRPSEENAHPHRAGKVVVIHNGIIENYLELKAALESKGRTFQSETDTEVISQLIDERMSEGLPFLEAARATVKQLHGSFSIVVLCDDDKTRLLAAKTATPIVIGLGKGENFIASDIPAILDHTREVLFLEDGEMAEVSRDGVKVTTFDGEPVERAPKHITWDPVTAQKGGYKHFLAKEIHEQPQAMIDTMLGRIRQEEGDVALPELDALGLDWSGIKRIYLTACGTAWHSCLVGKFLLEEMTRIPVDVDYASEFRYRQPILGPDVLLIAVSQSGETADTLAAVEEARSAGAKVLAICNVVDASIPRRANGVLYTHAGPEISVASTKAFTTQLTAFYLLSLYLGRQVGRLDEHRGRGLVADLVNLPSLVQETLTRSKQIEKISKKYGHASDFLYLGRGINYPIALEGALKLKEISYIHAEGYPAGEMKHGPIALIDEQLPVVVLLPKDPMYPKTLSNLKEVEARGGRIIALTDAPSPELDEVAWEVITIPQVNHLLAPILLVIPLQLLAYSIAVYRGSDVDQPRNLAKSVTVE